MKTSMLFLVLFIGFGSYAQPNKEQRNKYKMERYNIAKDLSAEELATLRTKKLTLQLDLNEAQQNSVKELLTAHITKRKANLQHRPQKGIKKDAASYNSESYYKNRIERLDHQIAFQNTMKTILTTTQFENWKSLQQSKAKRK